MADLVAEAVVMVGGGEALDGFGGGWVVCVGGEAGYAAQAVCEEEDGFEAGGAGGVCPEGPPSEGFVDAGAVEVEVGERGGWGGADDVGVWDGGGAGGEVGEGVVAVEGAPLDDDGGNGAGGEVGFCVEAAAEGVVADGDGEGLGDVVGGGHFVVFVVREEERGSGF